MQNVHSPNTINPFALAEIVAQKRIDWDIFENPTQALCDLLNIPYKELFYGKCPIMTPFTESLEDGTEKVLSEEEARARLESYLSGKMKRRITRNPPISKLTLKTIKKRILDTLTPKPIIHEFGDFPDRVEIIRPKPEIDPEIVRPITHGPVKRDLPWEPEGFEWLDTGMYFNEVPEFSDVDQGAIGDCSFMAALSALVWTRPYVIKNEAKVSELGNETSPIHSFKFYDEKGKASTVEVSERIPMKISGNQRLYYYGCSTDRNIAGQPDEIWPAVIEKAYFKWQTGTSTDQPNYNNFKTSKPGAAVCQIHPGIRTILQHNKCSLNEILDLIKDNCNGKKAVHPLLTFTPDPDYVAQNWPDRNYEQYGITQNHSFTILGWDEKDGEQYVVLRNPWARDNTFKDILHGDWCYDVEDISKKIPYGQKGVFALRVETYHKYFYCTEVVHEK